MVCLFTDTSVGQCATDEALGPDRHPQHLSALEVLGLRTYVNAVVRLAGCSICRRSRSGTPLLRASVSYLLRQRCRACRLLERARADPKSTLTWNPLAPSAG